MNLFGIFRRKPAAGIPLQGGAGENVNRQDLFTLAKPVRDASMVEMERLLARDNVPLVLADGHRLGTHLVALCIAHSSERQRTLEQHVRPDYDVHAMFAVAIGMIIGYAGSSFRPMINGQPLPPTVSGRLLMEKIGRCAMEQLINAENGTLDFNVTFTRNENGEITPEDFDFAKLMKGRSS